MAVWQCKGKLVFLISLEVYRNSSLIKITKYALSVAYDGDQHVISAEIILSGSHCTSHNLHQRGTAGIYF